MGFLNKFGGSGELTNFLPYLLSMNAKFELFSQKKCIAWAECALPSSLGAKETETRLQSVWKMNINPLRQEFFGKLGQVVMQPSTATTFYVLENCVCDPQDIGLQIGKVQSLASKGLLGMITK